MAEKVYSIKSFMRAELNEPRVVEIPGVATFSDEAGNPIPMKIREITSGRLAEMRKQATRRHVVKDAKGKPVKVNGQFQYTEDVDSTLLTNIMIAEAMVFPDLHDKELLEFYHEMEAVKLVNKVFARLEDYQYIADQIQEVSGLNRDADDIIDEAKN